MFLSRDVAVGRTTPYPNQLGEVLHPASMDCRIQGLWDDWKEKELTLSMVATNSSAAEVMWKMMMKARSTNIFTGRGGARSHASSPERQRGRDAKGGAKGKYIRQ